MADEYVFIDEWDVDAPVEVVFNALADATTYPKWWNRVYKEVTSDGPPGVGRASQQRFKGQLPYVLRMTSTIVRYEPPREFEVDATGDLRGKGVWTLTTLANGGTHVKFDWRVYADKPIVKLLTPILRPLFRWNHAWSIARARGGLEPYCKAQASSGG
ncbi:MAG TPA: SRPBCC family protein [Dehalococcoidia bacterium]|nr:SRPBCC family protein [Dehalococcoidia bacterium]